MGPLDSQPRDWREWRRIRAFELARSGWEQHAIADALDASEPAVSQWLATAERSGPEALRSRPHPGPAARLSEQQVRLIPDFLWHGPEAYGFRGNVWTCTRVTGVLAEEFGVSYSRSQVSRLLKRLGWTPQIPITRAIQRDEEAIGRWRDQVWPRLKEKAARQHLTLVFVDESGFYLLPSVVKTYAPRGQTPTLYEWQTRDHLSVMGAVTSEGDVYSLVREESLNGLHTIEFLVHLMQMVGKRLLVIWDRSRIHRRAEAQAFLAEPASRHVHVELLPPYAPDLNPAEWLWSHLKEAELHNLACLDLEQLHTEFHLALGRVRNTPALVRSFFEAAGLSL
jgi:transposase